MREQNPYETLGVGENASFEEIQDAKQRLSQQNREDRKAVEQIEAAYDAIIMERLRLRQEGKIKVPDGIRFPEKEIKATPKLPSISTPNSPSWLQQFIDTPSRMDIVQPAAAFLVLSLIAAFGQTSNGSLLSILLPVGIFANIYFLSRKEGKVGRSILITLVGLIVGIGASALIEQLGLLAGGAALGSDQFACLATFVLFWLISSFLR